MIGCVSVQVQGDKDFKRALLKASVRRWKTRLRWDSDHDRLLSFDEAKGALSHWSQVYRGMRTVELERIIGSVGRYKDFDHSRYFVAFIGISAGFQQDTADLTLAVLAFTAVVVLGWTWISALSVPINELSEARYRYGI
jgi:hypothetical protein